VSGRPSERGWRQSLIAVTTSTNQHCASSGTRWCAKNGENMRVCVHSSRDVPASFPVSNDDLVDWPCQGTVARMLAWRSTPNLLAQNLLSSCPTLIVCLVPPGCKNLQSGIQSPKIHKVLLKTFVPQIALGVIGAIRHHDQHAGRFLRDNGVIFFYVQLSIPMHESCRS
jgi:hypothetical protein